MSKLFYDICYFIFNYVKICLLIYGWFIMYIFNDKNVKIYQVFGLYKCINVRYDFI